MGSSSRRVENHARLRPASTGPQEPIRAELFGSERLERHAESLAAADRNFHRGSRERDLPPRVRDKARAFLDAYHSSVEAVSAKSEITLAEEWLLDNFHVVDEQTREIRDHLPKGYYQRLPKIAAGHLAGTPRVYGLAWAYVAHTDSHFEIETLERFVRAYQRVEPLAIGELWAVPIHLRMPLVENRRRLSNQIAESREARAAANVIADRLLGLRDRPAEDSDDVLRPLKDTPLHRAFAVQLVQRLREQTHRSLRHWNGSIADWVSRERTILSSWYRNTRPRAPPPRRCATSSAPCAGCLPSTGSNSSRTSVR